MNTSTEGRSIQRPLSKKEAISPYREGLPKVFIRKAKRGRDWGMPRRFSGYQASGTHEMSIAGAATKCFLSRKMSLEGAYIAKFAHKNGSIETYTELFNNQLGEALKFNMAHSGIALLDNNLHFLSQSFRRDPGHQLLHGSFLLQESGLASQLELEFIKTIPSQQDVYDIDFVKSVIYHVCRDDADKVFGALIEMLTFDALIGSMDRHPRNWGVLRTATMPAHYELSPIYDSARALLWDRTDDNLAKLEADEQEFQRYVSKSYPRIGLPKSEGHTGKCTHEDLIRYLLREHSEVTLRAYTKIRVDVVKSARHLLRQYPFSDVFSKRRSRMICRLLAIRQTGLLHLINKEETNAITLG